ncbi:MAG: helix-turn-helix domain-containing protein [Sphingomonadaceae bacterium]|nr:helix-turn-helix domain-containing protein [Sphingomonadaceae bacterium]
MAVLGAQLSSGRASARLELREQRAKAGNLNALVARLGLAAPTDAGEILTIRALWRSMQRHRAHQPVAESEVPLLITDGWACHRRRIGLTTHYFLFLLPGDFILPSRLHANGASELVALTPLETVDATPLTLLEEDGSACAPKARRLIAETRSHCDALILDHLFRVTACDARGGLAHMLLELLERLNATGRCVGGRFPLPVGQRPIGKAMGLSTLHVHKTLNNLRRDGLVDFGRGWMEIAQPERLERLAQPSARQARAG